MLDLSNNNGTKHDFRRAYINGGQRRVYLKRVGDEGRTHRFVDPDYPILRANALAAGFKVGAYTFTEPLQVEPRESAELLLSKIDTPLHYRHDLRPCLDVEWGTPSAKVGKWVKATAAIIVTAIGVRPLIYGSGYYLQACELDTRPGPLWLAAYGRNDGREYPIRLVPRPWQIVGAHQYTSEAHVIGIDGPCDLSHVFRPALVDVPRLHQLPIGELLTGMGSGRVVAFA